MAKETYPLPRQAPRLVYNNTNPEYGATREQYEERVFRQAHHFNVVRFTPTHGDFIATVKTFPEAIYLALGDESEGNKLIYVVTERGDAFCMSPKDYGKYALLHLALRGEKA